ncbi:MAG TPA: hypothetical protein VL101_06815, partial [Nordella sp.]|nr:hypothetical protein [Nordella sp.]
MQRRAGDASSPTFGGLNSRPKFDASRFRAEQIAPLAQFRPYIMGANALAVMTVVWASLAAVSGPWLYLWAMCQAGLTAMVLSAWLQNRNFTSSNRRTIAAIEATSLIFALLWAFPTLELMSSLPRQSQHVILAVCFITAVTGAFALT